MSSLQRHAEVNNKYINGYDKNKRNLCILAIEMGIDNVSQVIFRRR